MKLTTKIKQLALILSALPLAAMAGEMGTIYTQVGTNGVGLGYAKSVTDTIALRAQINALNMSFTGDVGDFGSASKLDVNLSMGSVQVVGDWYPTDGGLRLSGGLVFNNNKITVKGVGSVNGKSATVDAEVKMSDGVAPYLGVGYSTRPKDAKGLGFNFDLGAMFQNPKATLAATGPGVTAADVETQRLKVQEAADKLKVMPVNAVGVSYSF